MGFWPVHPILAQVLERLAKNYREDQEILKEAKLISAKQGNEDAQLLQDKGKSHSITDEDDEDKVNEDEVDGGEEEEDGDLEADFDRGVDIEPNLVKVALRNGLTNSGDVVIDYLDLINVMDVDLHLD